MSHSYEVLLTLTAPYDNIYDNYTQNARELLCERTTKQHFSYRLQATERTSESRSLFLSECTPRLKRASALDGTCSSPQSLPTTSDGIGFGVLKNSWGQELLGAGSCVLNPLPSCDIY